MSIITLITDFGLEDAYVGIMKGVILNINPHVQLVDLTHKIRPQSVKEASFLLKSAYGFFPKGTIHVAVVDPGVGSERRPLLVKTPSFFFIAPDNGILELIYQTEPVQVFHLNNPKYFLPEISVTFHARDVFAPIAGYLSLGKTCEELGIEVYDYQRLEWPLPKVEGNFLKGEVIYIDHFGNLITNISKHQFQNFIGNKGFSVKIKNIVLKNIAPHYLAVLPGEILAIWGSSEYLEIAQSMGSAKHKLKANIGEKIEIKKETK